MKAIFTYLLTSTLVVTICGCNRSTAQSAATKTQLTNSPTAATANTSSDIAGPIEIPRGEISTKYGWNGKTFVVPANDKPALVLMQDQGNNAAMIEVNKEGMEIKRFEKVGDGWHFAGGNLQIGNLIFSGPFTWNDDKIKLDKGAKMSLASKSATSTPAEVTKVDTVCIAEDGMRLTVKIGQLNFRLNPNGPAAETSEGLVQVAIFRGFQDKQEQAGKLGLKVGVAYLVKKDGGFQYLRDVDLKLSDNELAKQFGVDTNNSFAAMESLIK